MQIEKAFAVEGAPGVIWDALWSDLTSGEPGRFEVERAQRPNTLALRIDLGRGVTGLITYRIELKEDLTEVSATLQPLTFWYSVYSVLTLGRVRTNYEMLLVQGLSNLKTAVEGRLLE